MNYRVAELVGTDIERTKQTLIRNGDTLDILMGEGEPLPARVSALADNISIVNASGGVIARIKSADGVTWDKRLDPIQDEPTAE